MDDPTPTAWQRQHTLILLAIMLLAFCLRAFWIDFPREQFFDEIYYVNAAHDYLEGREDQNSVHPPLAKIQLAASMLLFDVAKLKGLHSFDDVVGWRSLPLLSGVGVVGLSAWLGYILTHSPRAALIAAWLVAIEHMSIAESRICTLDNVQAFWIALGLCCGAMRLFRSQENRWLIFCGLAMGVATGCKWNGLFAAGGVALAMLGLVRGEGVVKQAHPVKTVLAFAVTTALVYSAAYIPYRYLNWDKPLSKVVREIKGQHERMVKFRYNPKEFRHQYISQFYQWPFVVRPVWFHFKMVGKNSCTGIVAFGMVLFWWFAVYLMLECLAGGWRSDARDPAGQYLVLTYLSQWLLWASSITGGFIYYMLPIVPIMAVLVARQLELWLAGPASRSWAVAYLAALTVMSALYYPFTSGQLVPYKMFTTLFFIKSWY